MTFYRLQMQHHHASIKRKVPTKPKTKGAKPKTWSPGFFTVKLFSLKLIGFSPENGWNMKDPFWGDGWPIFNGHVSFS